MSSPALDLVQLFDALPPPTGDSPAGRFSAQPISGLPACSVGKDTSGYPVLLVETDATGQRALVAPIVLQNLSVLHNVDCRLQEQGGSINTRRLSVIRCCGEDRVLHEYFL